MIGERIFPDRYGHLRLTPGSFGRDLRGRWQARPPGEDTSTLEQASVDEHADGTISFRGHVNGGASCFLLERGIWTEVKGDKQ